MITGLFSRNADIEIVPMEPEDSAQAADVHAAGFARAWSADEIDALISQSNVYGFVARSASAGRSQIAGFVLARFAADEAEVLTVAVRERFRKRGLGWRLMLAAIGQMRLCGAETMFLEVDEKNAAGVGLYRRLGFHQVAERSAYYKQADGRRSAALVMRLDLI